MEEFLAANRLNWDDRAGLHSTDTTGMYGIAEVIAGGDCLHAIESAEIDNVAGKRLVHLQCHIGTDTISLAHRGAIVTGLDFSEPALDAARSFASRAGRDVRFVQQCAVRPGEGIATGRIGPETRITIVDAIVSGVHAPGESHFELLRAFADDAALRTMAAVAEAHGYRNHEFGDSVLIERRVRRAARTGRSPCVGSRATTSEAAMAL